MGGGVSVVLVEGGTASLSNTGFISMFSPDPAGLVQATLPGSAVRLENITTEAVSAAHPFRLGDGAAIYADSDTAVYNDSAAKEVPALTIADIPDERLFLATTDQWLVQLQEVRLLLQNMRHCVACAESPRRRLRMLGTAAAIHC